METADQIYATEVVSYLLGSFPQQAPDPEVYASQLIALCVGRPKTLLRKMVNPVEGLSGDANFLPSLAEVKAWLEDNSAGPVARAYPLLPPVKDKPEDPPEVKEAALQRWKRVKSEMRSEKLEATAHATRLKWKQYHDPAALVEALGARKRDAA